MSKTMKIILGIAGVFVLAILASGALLLAGPVQATFAQAPTQTEEPPTAAPAQSGIAAYENIFLDAFAKRLGVTVDAIKNAYAGALGDTLNQAVQDGKITQNQADQIQNKYQNMQNKAALPGFFLPFERGLGRFERRGAGRFGFGVREFGVASFAKALNMPEADLISELKSGKTIADIAAEKNINLDQVKTSVLNDIKARLDQAVQNGNLTQNQADNIYQQASNRIDNLMNQTLPVPEQHFGWN